MSKDNYPEDKSNNKKRQLNIGIIVCAIIILYLVVNFCIYLFNGRTEIYEASVGQTASRYEGQYNALILREETIVNSAGSGYINFFVGDATNIHASQQTYVVDGTGEISSMLEKAAKDQSILSDANLSKIRSGLYDFDTSFREEHYYDIYNYKYKVESQILELINSSVFESINADLSSSGENAYKIVSSDISGIMLHHIDGFENIKPDMVETSSFNKSDYQKNIIKSNDLVEEGSPVYKVVTSEKWNLIFQISDPTVFENTDYLTIQFLKDNIVADAAFEMFTKAGNTYGVLTLNKYMIRYVTERYTPISIIDNTKKGIKVPKTAITEKQYYTIPVEYLSQGGNSSDYGFNKEVILEDGSTSIVFVTPAIVKKTDQYCYVGTDDFSDGDVLIKNDSDSRYQVGAKENLQGVLVARAGYATFRNVDIIGENNSFYIVDPVTSRINLFEQIVKNASKVKENDIINR